MVDEQGRPTEDLGPAFEEWRSRTTAALHLMHGSSRRVPKVRRPIVPSSRVQVPVPDLPAFHRAGRGTDQERTEDVLNLLATPGTTSPLTAYHMTWDGTVSDADPSLHL